MISTYKPKNIELLVFGKYNYDFQFIHVQEINYVVDENGNFIHDQETDVYREYNELNQLIRTRINNASGTILQEYTWEPLQERIFIKDEFYSNGSLKSSTYYFGDDYIVIQNSSGTYNRTNIYQDGILFGYEDVDGKKSYVLPDHEGSAHIILNESGDVIEENLFSPFAEPLQGVNVNKFSYEAKEYDPLTKDYDFHFRKFSVNGPPILNQPDTLIQNVYDPQLLNRYMFERANPYRYTDPTGHDILDALLTVLEFQDSADTITESNPQVAQNKAEGFLVGTLATFGITLVASTAGVALLPAITIGTIGGLIIGGLHTSVKNKQLTNIQNTDDIKCYFGPCSYNNIRYGVPKNPSSPTKNNPQSQANNAFATSNAISNSNPTNSGSFISGVWYVTNDGKVYPTTNKDFKPGTGNKPYSPGKEVPCKLNCAKILKPSPVPKKPKRT